MRKTLEEWKEELVGKEFGVLTVKDVCPHIRKSSGKNDGFEAVCLCVCGREVIKTISSLFKSKDFCTCDKFPNNALEKWKKLLLGKTFGFLTAISIEQNYDSLGKKKGFRVLCTCVCGKSLYVTNTDLYKGHTTSCGCKKSEYCKKSFSLWKKDHPDEYKERIKTLRQWHIENPEKSKNVSLKNLEKAKEWRENHPEEARNNLEKTHEKFRLWVKEHPEVLKNSLEKARLWSESHREEIAIKKKKSMLNRVSKEEKEVYLYLCSLGYEVEQQVFIEDHFYDFRVGDFLIEYNGSSYHYTQYENKSNPNAKEPSTPKAKDFHYILREKAIRNNFHLIQIWDYDWLHKKDFIKTLLKEQLDGYANYKDYIEDDGLLNNDFGFLIEGLLIQPKYFWVLPKYRTLVSDSYNKGKFLVYNSGYTLIK